MSDRKFLLLMQCLVTIAVELLLIVLLQLYAHAQTVTLTWTNPTTNEDGTPCTDLATIELGAGATSGSYSLIRNVGLTESTEVTPPSSRFYAVRAVDLAGNRSAWSNEKFVEVGAATPTPTPTETPTPTPTLSAIDALKQKVDELEQLIRGSMAE